MTFQVEAEDLTAHASHLDGLADRFDTAISAAETAMSDDAYGLLCSFLPPIINPTEEEGMAALKAAKEGVTTTADNVRQTAKEYQETDEAGADNFGKFDDAVRVKESAVAQLGVPAVAGGASGTAPTGFNMGEPAGTTASGYNAQSGGAGQAMPQEFAGRAASGPAMSSDSDSAGQMTPASYAEPRQAPEGFQRAELRQMSEPMQAEPRQMAEPFQRAEGAQRYEPRQMAEPAHLTEPRQMATPASFSGPLHAVQQGVPAGDSEALRPMNQGAPASYSEPLHAVQQGIPAGDSEALRPMNQGIPASYDAPVRNREA
ncbi:Excreted virulence factor EspC, type VII ESX diderm [Saccharopolyspora antimicrobica]|uniref:Excreted virulence factor EspC (Type VII ESX diderm) n=1 Tax=Saccharopolyspora antimicrobica TaxID=455193 RepID=A0A1I4XGA5_9PSEU|nr:type VII secretion target [Saccharopolyspora antimicrobica]RKT84496.1 excreted virulence factor EspC (type VII ESX diderm) [Saccharopolyspora antimicrobica]SFN24805.1 Excreted virulence factor EspC, type VII ESX diderm [Saccharopolyspora antimicrobica]